MKIPSGSVMEIPRRELTGQEIYHLVDALQISNFRGVFCADEIPPPSGSQEPFEKECGILNFQKHTQGGSHWTAWYKNGKDIVYYDSYGGVPPPALAEYLNPYGWIKRSVVITQQGPTECGGLCLYVLQALTRGRHFGQILEKLVQRRRNSSSSSSSSTKGTAAARRLAPPLYGMETGVGKGASRSAT